MEFSTIQAVSTLLQDFPVSDFAGYFRPLAEQNAYSLLDKRIQDLQLAKAFHDLALAAEKQQKTNVIPKFYNACLNLTILRSLHNTQATLIVCLLRAYLLTKNLALAVKFLNSSTFPEQAGNNLFARFFYYQGRIRALQLDYVSAADLFERALRKAPQGGAVGFRQNVQKWVVLVQLLQGEIPKRAIFRETIHRRSLGPYLRLAQAVRSGNVAEFNKLLDEFNDSLKADETLSLVVRLRANVIKTAIRLISTTYSRIYMKDIAKKLQLSSEVEAEYVVAKTIKERIVVNAAIVSDAAGLRYLETSDPQNVYQTKEPQQALHKRITDCLELHNMAVRALRYPSAAKSDEDQETLEQQHERELMEIEYASEMADDDGDF